MTNPFRTKVHRSRQWKGRQRRGLILVLVLAMTALLLVHCRPGAPAATPTPTKTRVVLALATNTPLPSPTLTPMPSATLPPMPSATVPEPSPTPEPPTDTPPPPPTDTPPLPLPTETATSSPATKPTSPPAPAVTPTATTAASTRPPLAPQQGGEWDMETGFVPGFSPLGEDCPGWAVAAGWAAFLAPGTPASSCLNENKNPANVRSGQRSQEITFDFISAEAGIYKAAQTIPGHRYQIEAWGKHTRSQSPVELFLGVDVAGGEDWQAGSVTWHPWAETEEEAWVHTQVTVRAGGERMTVFLKGYHPFATQGGATLFDDVRIVDLGP